MMMTTRSHVGMTDLHVLAEALGVRVRRVDHGPPAYYRHSERTIYTRRGQSVESYRSALAHELVHAYYGDAPCRDPVRHARQEQRADRFAAELLITPEAWAEAEAIHDGHLGAIADELEVTIHLARTWRDNHERSIRS